MTHRLETLAVHAGQEQSDPATNARAVPIYQTTSFVFDNTEHAADLFALRQPGNIYARIMNPTQDVFEQRMTALEGGIGSLATAAGSAAITYAVMNLAQQGDNIVSVSTPFLCRPIEHGADVVVHSATKYIGGHGTAMGGVITDAGTFDWAGHAERFPNMTGPDSAYHGVIWTDAAGPAAYITRARTVLMRNMGAVSAPMNNFLFLQGLESLHVRMERHCSNALAVATHLKDHPKVAWVNYPGFDDSPHKAVADRVLTGHGYGGLVSFGLKDGREAGASFIDALQLFSHLANIGDAKSLAIHNATTTHSQLEEDELRAAGVAPEMVRLSIGLEHVDDLIADLDQALEA